VSGAPIEVATMRVVGTGRTVRPSLVADAEAPPSRPAANGSRAIAGERAGAMVRFDVPAYDRAAMQPGCTIDGPALVDAVDTTLWVPDGFRASVDAYRTLVLEVSR
jgi:N-methylhydantoinase A